MAAGAGDVHKGIARARGIAETGGKTGSGQMNAKQIFIHAGAHRTGTSSFQNCLAQNRAALESEGFDLAYPGRDGAPGGRLRLRLPQPRDGRHGRERFELLCRESLRGHSPDPARALILSEENIPGRMNFRAGRMFPLVDLRAAMLGRAIAATEADWGVPAEVVHLVYVVRPFDELFVSAFLRWAEDRPAIPFADAVPKMVAFKGSWHRTVQALRDGLRPVRLSVVEYGRRGESRDLLARLVGGEAARFGEPGRNLNVSPGDAALFALQEKYHAGETVTPEEKQRIVEAGEGQESPAFAAFSPAQVKRLRERYARDLEQVAALEGVEFIA